MLPYQHHGTNTSNGTTEDKMDETAFFACGGCGRPILCTRSAYEAGELAACPYRDCDCGVDLRWHRSHVGPWDELTD